MNYNIRPFKILLLGDSNVGKSSLLLRYTENIYVDDNPSTIGIDFRVRSINIDGKQIKLQIWDASGQERFRSIASSYYRGCDGIILVYDITNRKSFDNLKNWILDINSRSISLPEIIIIGNKSDLEDKREVSYDDGWQFSHELGYEFFEISTKNSVGNINTIFSSIAEAILVSSPQILPSKETIQLLKPKTTKCQC